METAHYRNRDQIERFFGRRKQFRQVAPRNEKTLESIARFLRLVTLMANVL